MAILIITAYETYLPDPNNMVEWEERTDNDRHYFFCAIGEHKLYLKKCSEKERRQTLKYTEVVQFVEACLHADNQETPDNQDNYLIVHDKDLLRPREEREGIYQDVDGRLSRYIPNGHIYLFQHSLPPENRQNMFDTLIKKLLIVTEKNITDAIQLINNKEYETGDS